MSKAKKGKHAPNIIRRGPFLLLWSFSYAALWTVLIIYSMLRAPASTMINVDLVGEVGLLAGTGVFALLQQRLLQRPVMGWALSTLVGTLITLGVFNSALNTGSPTMLMLSLALLVPTSLVQMVWLLRQVKSAWLWPLANIAAAMSFAFLFRDKHMAELGIGVVGIGILQGLIQALVMRHLWTPAENTATPTSQSLVDDLTLQKAIETLTLNDTSHDILDDELRLKQQQQQ